MPASQTSPQATGKARQKATGVARCLAEIRRMIASGELLPGQKMHQAELAAQLDMSRIPVREALSTLQAEGVLVHKPPKSYFGIIVDW